VKCLGFTVSSSYHLLVCVILGIKMFNRPKVAGVLVVNHMFFSGVGFFKQHIHWQPPLHHTPKRVRAVFRPRFLEDIFAGNNFTGTHYLNADKKLMRSLTNLYHQTLRGNPENLWKDGDFLHPPWGAGCFFPWKTSVCTTTLHPFFPGTQWKTAKSVAEGTAKQPLAMFFFVKSWKSI